MSDSKQAPRYEVNTSYAGGIIQQELYLVHEDYRQQIMRIVLNTSEAKIREALIAMGWTPPGAAQERGEAADALSRVGEPVAWMLEFTSRGEVVDRDIFLSCKRANEIAERDGGVVIPLYTALQNTNSKSDENADSPLSDTRSTPGHSGVVAGTVTSPHSPDCVPDERSRLESEVMLIRVMLGLNPCHSLREAVDVLHEHGRAAFEIMRGPVCEYAHEWKAAPSPLAAAPVQQDERDEYTREQLASAWNKAAMLIDQQSQPAHAHEKMRWALNILEKGNGLGT